MPSDSEIIGRVLRGQTDEFRKLVVRHRNSVYALAYRMLGNREGAEDAAQDAFVRAFRALHGYSVDSAFWPWLRRIVVNCCLKRSSTEIPSDDIESLVDSAAGVSDSVMDQVFRNCDLHDLRRAIVGLPSEYRRVVVLKYQEDLETSEIADMLGEPAGTIRVRLHRALKMLGERLVVMQNELQR